MMGRLDTRTAFLVSFTLLYSCVLPAQKSDSDELKKYTSNLPFTMPVPQLPSIPEHTVLLADFGAVGDGHTMNTKAFASAIDACSKAGGGRVVIPPGVWLTGPIELKSNIDLHAERGALIVFSKKFEDYPMTKRGDEKSKRYRVTSPIFGYHLENVAITGPGVFNGSGEAWRPHKKSKTTPAQWRDFVKSGGVVDASGEMWWPSQEAMNGEKYLADLMKRTKNPTPEEFAGAREFLRPDMVVLVDCKKVLLDGPTFENSPTFCVHPIECEDLVIRNIHIRNEWWAQNGDALDIGSCHNVLIYNCIINAGDDGICLKPGGFDKKRGWTAACENIAIADCIVYHAHGGFVIGSEGYGGVRNISVKNMTFIGTDVGLRFKSSRGRGGLVEKVFIDGVFMRDIVDQAILFDTYYAGGSPESRAKEDLPRASAEPVDERTPRFDGMTIENIVCNGANRAILVTGLPEMAVKHVTLKNVTISADKGVFLSEAEGFTMMNTKILAKSEPVIVLKDSRNITLDRVSGPGGGTVFLRVNGESSDQIQLVNIDLSSYKSGWELGKEIKQGIVTRK